MATTRSTQRPDETPTTPSTNSSAADGGQAGGAREVLVDAARIQLATIAALSRFFTGWAQSSDRYVHAVTDELHGRVHGQINSSDLMGRLAAASNLHLRELSALPTETANHFRNELTKKARSRTLPRLGDSPAR